MGIFEDRAPEIIKTWNDSTWLVMDRGVFYVCKEVRSEDLELYRELVEVNNSYIAKVFDVCVVNGRLCAVQEYIQGETLEEYLQDQGAQPASVVCTVALELCEGLAALHSRGVVHRDLTPKNIVVTTDGVVKIIDFGISRVEKAEASSDTEFLGTAGFAAPEQYGFKQTTARTDIYALGVLMNYMMTLKFPNEEHAPGVLWPVIEKCTKMDEADRYQNTDAVAKVLRALSLTAGQETPESSGVRHVSREKATKEKESEIVPTKTPVSDIPGFRHNVWWHKMIAALYYFSAGMLMVGGGFIGDYGIDGRFLIPVAFALMYLSPVPIVFNMGGWLNKLPWTAGKARSVQVIWQVLMYLICLLIAIVLIIIV